MDDRYRVAFVDWLACVAGGRDEPAAVAARAAGDGLLERVAAVATAGHVLDFDDTYTPGLAHLSAAAGPAALVLGAERDAPADRVLAAFAAGFEAMGAVSRASHSGLYDRHLHPTAVCGPVGAAAAAAVLLELDAEATDAALALALLRGSGLLAAFGGPGKALQVGLAASAGVATARLVESGAEVDLERAADGFAAALGGRFARPDPDRPAIAENWIKAWPCCLQTHSAIEAAEQARPTGVTAGDDLEILVHPLARRAAPYDDAADGLQAKFSIPYTVAHTLARGAPDVAAFATVDPEVRGSATSVTVLTDDALGEQEARLSASGGEIARVVTALGSPTRPLPPDRLAEKIRGLTGGTDLDVTRPPGELLASAWGEEGRYDSQGPTRTIDGA